MLKKIGIFSMVLVMLILTVLQNVQAEDFTTKKIYNIEWTDEQLTTPENWFNSKYFGKPSYKESRFQKYYAQETNIELGAPRETSFYMTYGEEGLNIFIQANEPDKDNSGSLKGSTFEIFLSPGLDDVYYYQFMITQTTGDMEYYDWQTEGRQYQPLKGKISAVSKENADGWGTAIVIPWDCLPELPVDGDYWRFSLMRWASYYLDSSTWGGNVHETGKFNLIYFQPPTLEQRTTIQKTIINKAWKSFNQKAQQLTDRWDTNGTARDKYFYNNSIKPLIDEYTAYGSQIANLDNMSVAEIESMFGHVKNWKELAYDVEDSRTKYLKSSIMSGITETEPEVVNCDAALTVNGPVYVEKEFTVSYGLKLVDQSVYAQDITIKYNPDAFDFIEAQSLSEKTVILGTDNSVPGTCRLIVANTGEAITQDGPVLDIKFKAKENAAGTETIELLHAKLADSKGTVINAETSGIEVTVNAAVEPETYTVTFDVDGVKTAVTVNVGEPITKPANPTKEGYTFKGWYTAATAGTEVTQFTSIMTVYAQWTQNTTPTPEPTTPATPPTTPPTPTPAPTPTRVPETKVEEGKVTTTIPVNPVTDADGKAVAEISDTQLADAIAKAKEEAANQSKKTEAVVRIDVSASADAKTAGIYLTEEALKKFIDSKADKLEITTPFGTMTFDGNAAAGILKQSPGTITITATIVEVSELTEEIMDKVGERPVVSFDITSEGKEIAQLGGKATVTIPYTLKAGEKPNALVVYYINTAGKLETVTNCKYDPALETLTFKTPHFSRYAVGYNKVDFADVADNVWYSDAVTFAAAREITEGVGNGNFGSEETITRAQSLVMIMKAFGISPDIGVENNFNDAGDTYYTGYLAAAKRLGITSGVGDNMFAPDRQVTRQEMFVLVYNTLKNINELPTETAAKKLADFKDAVEIADYANNAIELFVKTGIISGTNGNILPVDSASRAQFVQILYNIIIR